MNENSGAPDPEQGLYRKYDVTRLNDPTGKHKDCTYYILDLDHDPHSVAALLAYAKSCEAQYPTLAFDLRHTAAATARKLNVASVQTEEERTPEGCTPTDARVLREANGIFAEENHQLRRTLRFYAHREHVVGLKHWEGPSGDDNWLCPPGEDFGDYRKQFIDALDEAMVEDGTLARSALRGVYLDMDGEPELAPVEGEPEWKIEQEAKALLSPHAAYSPEKK
jgi:hypothetical protein